MNGVMNWMYEGGRPNRLARVLNRSWATIWGAGLSPAHWATLEVRGRTSGKLISFPVVVLEDEGERYLVSMLGERSSWVANVRADNGRATLRHRSRTPVRLDEVPPESRAALIKRYLDRAPGARPHIPVDRHAPLAEFERIAPSYPVFRILPGKPLTG